MKVVCSACKNVCEAGAPAPAPPGACEACGAALAQVAASDPAGLVVREATGGDGARVLLLGRPRAPALRTLAFGLAWNLVVGCALVIAWLNDGGLVLALLALFAAVGLAVVYTASRGLVNHVRFELGPRGLRIEERPLPAGRPLVHARAALLGFAVQPGLWEAASLRVLLRDGRAIELPYGFARQEQAAWIADRLQAWLDEGAPSDPYR